MKERIRHILKEETLKNELLLMIKDDGFMETSKIVGGASNLMEVMGIETPIEFLNIYNDVNVIEKNDKVKIYKYPNRKNNIMVYVIEWDELYVNFDEIFSGLMFAFKLDVIESKMIINRWVKKQFNITPDKIHTSRGSSVLMLNQ